MKAIRRNINPATILALVALVFAVTGGAYAASGSGGNGGGHATAYVAKKKSTKKPVGGKPGPRGPAGAKGATGPAGAAGPAGPAGPGGAAGAKGENGTNGINGENGKEGQKGDNGTNGASAKGTSFTGEKTVGSVTCHEGGIEVTSANPATAVCNGQTGFTETLPAGKTETGTWSVVIPPTEDQFEFQVPISFPIPLAHASAEGAAYFFTAEQVENEDFGTSGCHWEMSSNAKPEATTPGTLCVFTYLENLNGLEATYILKPGGELEEGYGPAGAFLYMDRGTTQTPGATTGAGVWAVTAPSS